MVEMKQRNVEEIHVLMQENEDMRRRLEGHPSLPLEDKYQEPLIRNMTICTLNNHQLW